MGPVQKAQGGARKTRHVCMTATNQKVRKICQWNQMEEFFQVLDGRPKSYLFANTSDHMVMQMIFFFFLANIFAFCERPTGKPFVWQVEALGLLDQKKQAKIIADQVEPLGLSVSSSVK